MKKTEFTQRSDQIQNVPTGRYLPSSDCFANLTLGQIDPLVSPELLKDSLQTKSLSLQYGSTYGLEELLENIAQEKSVSAQDLLITNGASEALFLTLGCLLEEGKKILLPRPSFPGYEEIVKAWGGTVIPYELKTDTNYSMGSILEKIDDGIDVVLLNSPHNPTGAIFSEEELSTILKACQRHQCWVISDEVYENFLYNHSEHRSILHQERGEEKTILIQSFSKSLGAPGLRLGYLFVQNKRLMSRLIAMKTHLSMCSSMLSQACVLEILKHPHQSNPLPQLQKNRDHLLEYLSSNGIHAVPPQGGFFMMVADPKLGKTEEEMIENLYQIKIAGLPGSLFHAPEPSVRLSFTSTEEISKLRVAR